MTSPNGSRGSSPLRVGGLALLGVGIVAAAIGLVSLNSGGGEVAPVAAPSLSTPAAAPPTSAPAPTAAPAAPEAAPPAAAAPAQRAPGAAEPQAPAPSAPLPTAAASAAGASAGSNPAAQAPQASVRVYNNSLVKGLAETAAQDFRNAGWTVDSVNNYSSGNIPTSTVYFRPGTGEEAAAQRMGSEFGLRAEPRFAGLSDASPGLIVILTNDYQRR